MDQPGLPIARGRGRIAALDAWRGIAILLVLVDHFIPFRNGQPVGHLPLFLGQHGVAVFFVLSGFLITSLLLDEDDREGRICLSRFYLRRFFRILPTAWCYLAVLLLLHVRLSAGELPASLFSWRNYLPWSPYTAHFWSLSIEEQFYLLWPALLLLLDRRHLLRAAVVAAAAIALWRILHWSQLTADLSLAYRTEFRADGLLLGCIAALLLRDERIRARWARLPILPLVAALAFCVWHWHILIPLTESAVLALLMVRTTLRPAPLLNFQPLQWLGRISYSVYVWQAIPMMDRPHQQGGLGVKLLVLLLLSLGSYFLIERPMLSLSRKVLGRKTMGRKVLGPARPLPIDTLVMSLPQSHDHLASSLESIR